MRSRLLSSLLLVPVLAVLVLSTAGFADNARRYDELGHKMMCACSCGQILIECNHLGCPDSERMLSELRSAVSRGDSENVILTAFQDKYGPTILAAPLLTRFNILAWVVPPSLLLIGIAGTVVLVRRWRRRAAALPVLSQPHTESAMRDRIRRETEL